MATDEREACGYDYPHPAHAHLAGGGRPRCPGVRAVAGEPGRTMPARARRDVVEILRAVRDGVDYLTARWHTRATVYLQQHERRDVREACRPRRYEEYPEADPAEWQLLAEQADDLAKASTILAQLARHHADQAKRAR